MVEECSDTVIHCVDVTSDTQRRKVIQQIDLNMQFMHAVIATLQACRECSVRVLKHPCESFTRLYITNRN